MWELHDKLCVERRWIWDDTMFADFPMYDYALSSDFGKRRAARQFVHWGQAEPLHTRYPPPWYGPRGAEFASPNAGEEAHGWPFLALWYRSIENGTLHADLIGAIRVAPNNPQRKVFRDRVLPYLPIPLGLLLNTLFYATLWSILLFAPRAIRRHLRTKRHRCPHCNYDLRNLPTTTCPECGAQS